MEMTAGIQQCPVCAGPMWDETQSKYYKPGKPIAKCKNKECKGVLWAPRNSTAVAPPNAPQSHNIGAQIPDLDGPALSHGAMVVEKLNDLLGTYTICFQHALSLAKSASPAVVPTLEGISAMTATILITAKEKGLA